MRRAPERSADLISDIMGVMPLPPPNSSRGGVAVLQHERPAGGRTCSEPPSASASLNQFEPLPPANRFTVTLRCRPSVSGALDSEIAAVEDALVVQAPGKGQELARPVPEAVGQLLGHLEHERPRIGVLDDLAMRTDDKPLLNPRSRVVRFRQGLRGPLCANFGK